MKRPAFWQLIWLAVLLLPIYSVAMWLTVTVPPQFSSFPAEFLPTTSPTKVLLYCSDDSRARLETIDISTGILNSIMLNWDQQRMATSSDPKRLYVFDQSNSVSNDPIKKVSTIEWNDIAKTTSQNIHCAGRIDAVSNGVVVVNHAGTIKFVRLSDNQELISIEGDGRAEIEIHHSLCSNFIIVSNIPEADPTSKTSEFRIYRLENEQVDEVSRWSGIPRKGNYPELDFFVNQNVDNTFSVRRPSDGELVAQLPACVTGFEGTWCLDPASNYLAIDSAAILISAFGQKMKTRDTNTGKLNRTVDPFPWQTIWLPAAVLTLIAVFAFWFRAWLKAASSLYGHGWIDVVFLSGLILGLLIARNNCFIEKINEWPFRILEGLFAFWMALSAVWLGFGRTRWTLRILPPILLLSIVMFLGTFYYKSFLVSVVLLCGCLIACLTILCCIAKLIGQKLNRDGLVVSSDKTFGKSFPLRDLFLLMFALGILFASARFSYDRAPAQRLGSTIFPLVPLMLGFYFVTGALGVIAGISARRRIVRCIAILISFLVMLPFSLFEYQFLYHCALISSAVLVAAGLAAYRVRGWRISA